jgi:putative Mg2+ transporter-C (MgtC) family protein
MSWSTLLESSGTHTPELEIALRLILAVLFGGVLGLERELRDRPAGLRTHMMTALAAALFTIITFEIFHTVRTLEDRASVDPIRIIEAVTAGVAFLAAGAIIQNRGRVQGLTTGAGMWLAGALGVACGVGYYTLALMATVLAFAILTILGKLERTLGEKEPDRRERR